VRSPRPSLPIRVYYEDTDAAGVVYYANYLKFMERARARVALVARFRPRRHRARTRILFVVHRLEIEFSKPAQLSDRLDVTMTLIEPGERPLADQVKRDADVWPRRVTLACLDASSWRPARIPAPLYAHMEALL
jgi:acyl-CoA thioester hydrolase